MEFVLNLALSPLHVQSSHSVEVFLLLFSVGRALGLFGFRWLVFCVLWLLRRLRGRLAHVEAREVPEVQPRVLDRPGVGVFVVVLHFHCVFRVLHVLLVLRTLVLHSNVIGVCLGLRGLELRIWLLNNVLLWLWCRRIIWSSLWLRAPCKEFYGILGLCDGF